MATNVNFLSPIEFQFIIERLPNVKFFVQGANVPGISSGFSERPTPFKTLYEPGEKLTYDDLTLTIICDEDLVTYREISKGLVALTSPESFDQYKTLSTRVPGGGVPTDTKNTKTSDGSLIILNSNKNANVSIKFKDLFPTTVSAMQLNTTGTDVTPPTFDITFKYAGYTIEV